uniref:Uncharacterized protein n=1 Tax=Rhizophora mucronata TaxID=61149 RepID=A0A2P2JLJ5_RHIMU
MRTLKPRRFLKAMGISLSDSFVLQGLRIRFFSFPAQKQKRKKLLIYISITQHPALSFSASHPMAGFLNFWYNLFFSLIHKFKS